MDSEDSGEGQNEFGPIFARMYSLFSNVLPSSRAYYKTVASDLAPPQRARILDVGCGTGNLIYLIAKNHPDASVYGVDPSPSMLIMSRKRTARLPNGTKIQLSEGNCLDVPFDDKFDIIVSSKSYHHWRNKQDGLRYLGERISDSGMLSIYENFSDQDTKRKSSTDTHSLTLKEADEMQVEGFDKSVKVMDDIISVTFRKKSRNKP